MLWNSRPPRPPPGQEGRGSYVWVPHDAPIKEQHEEGFLDVAAEEDNDGSMKTEEEYIDPYAADKGDFPEGGDIDEPGISADEEGTKNVGQIAYVLHL